MMVANVLGARRQHGPMASKKIVAGGAMSNMGRLAVAVGSFQCIEHRGNHTFEYRRDWAIRLAWAPATPIPPTADS